MELNSAIIIWVDILGAAPTGKCPTYNDICTEGLGDNSKLQLKDVMGCENWAMVVICETVVLVDWKIRMLEKGMLDVRELVSKSSPIERDLDMRLGQLKSELSKTLASSRGTIQQNDDMELVISKAT
jgi:hypothetical protein